MKVINKGVTFMIMDDPLNKTPFTDEEKKSVKAWFAKLDFGKINERTRP